MGALRDCEQFLDSWLGQPVNTITTLAFVVGGVVIWAKGGRRSVAVATAAVGIGSFLFHGPVPPGAQLAHDVTLWALVGLSIFYIALDWRRDGEWRHLRGPLALLAVTAIVGRLGSTGGPLCDSTSWLQPHGLWHVGAAVAVTWWAVGAGTRETPRKPWPKP